MVVVGALVVDVVVGGSVVVVVVGGSVVVVVVGGVVLVVVVGAAVVVVVAAPPAETALQSFAVCVAPAGTWPAASSTWTMPLPSLATQMVYVARVRRRLFEPRTLVAGSTQVWRRRTGDQELATSAGGVYSARCCSGSEPGRGAQIRVGDRGRSGAPGVAAHLGLVGGDRLGRRCEVRLAGCHRRRAPNPLEAEDDDRRQNPENGQHDEQFEKGEPAIGACTHAQPEADLGAGCDTISPPSHLRAQSLHSPRQSCSGPSAQVTTGVVIVCRPDPRRG